MIFHKSCDLFYSPNKVRTFSFSWQPQVFLYKMNVEDFLGHMQEQSLLLPFSSALSLVQLNPLSHDDERILIESPFFHPFLVISRSTAIVKTVSQIEITTNSCKLNIFLFFLFFFLFKFQAVYFYFLRGMNLQGRRVNSITKRQRARSFKKNLKQSYALKVLHPTETISSSLRLSIIIA